MAGLAPCPKFKSSDAVGSPLVGGLLYTYLAGTSTPLATYTDYSGGVLNTNPVVLDARGEADVWLGDSLYKFVLKDAGGVTIWTQDNIGAVNGGASISCDTYQSVRDLTAAGFGGKYIILRGRSSTGDGGEGTLIFVGTGYSPTDDDDGINFVTASGWLYRRFVLSDINVQWFGAVGDSVTDDLPAFNKARDYCTTNKRGLFVPQPVVGYRLSATWDLTTKTGVVRHGLNIEFENRSTQYRRGTLIYGDTGANPVIDTTGSDGIFIKNLGIVNTGMATPSKIGYFQARTAPSGTSWAGMQYLENPYIDLGSDPTANSGLGTIPYVNISGEETKLHNVEFWGNLPAVFSWSASVTCTDNALGSTTRAHTFTSPSGIALTTGNSNTVFGFSGTGRLIAYDYVSPIAYIQAGYTVDFGHTFMQKRLSGSSGVTVGSHVYAVETWGAGHIRHYGAVENCRAILLIRRQLETADINVRYSDSPDVAHTQPAIKFWSDGGAYKVGGLDIKLDYPGSVSHTRIGWQRHFGVGSSEPMQHSIDTLQLHCNSDFASGFADLGTFRNLKSGRFSFRDRTIRYTDTGCWSTEIEKNIGNTAAAPVLLATIKMPATIAASALGAAFKLTGIVTAATSGTVGGPCSVFLESKFSVTVANSSGATTVSTPSTTIASASNVNTAANEITAVAITVTADDVARTISIYAEPTTTGANQAALLLKATLECFATRGYKDDVLFQA